MSRCVTKDDRLVPGEAFHLRQETVCLCCQATYCISCHWGCRACGLLQGVDRRSEPRQSVQGNVDIQEDAG